MKIGLAISIILFFLAINGFAQQTKNVLFLGNSYTAANNLPSIVASIAHDMGDSLAYNENTPGGYTLQGHSTNASSIALINQVGWDYVVLQEQSQKPSWPISQVISDVFPYAKALSNMIVQKNPCAKPLFFMTWGRKNGDSFNCANWPPVCTYNGMDSLLNLRYRMMADSNDAYVSPVGAVWHYIRDTKPGINLYSADESHPSAAGSYAAACTFYTLIFQKDPNQISFDYGLDPVVAADIRMSTKIIAYDSLAKWNVGKYLPQAQFTKKQYQDTVYFTNNSINASIYDWDFGDGTTSKLFEPSHIYTASGNYQIVLEATKCDHSDTSLQSVQIIITAISHIENNFIKVFPNPISNKVNIQLQETTQLNNIGIYDINGRLIKTFENKTGKKVTLNTNSLSEGVYILKFDIDGVKYQYKLIKR